MKSFLLDIFSFSFCYGFLFFASIRSPFQGNKFSIHAKAVQDGRGGDGVKDFSPVGGDEVGGDQGGGDLGAFGEDLKDPIGLFFGGDDITQFIEAEDRDFLIILDKSVRTLGFGEFGREIKESEEDGLMPFEDGFVAKSRCKVRFADAGRTDKDKIAGGFEPLGLDKLHEFVPGDAGIEGPVEFVESFDPFDSGHTEQVLDSFLFSELILLGKETE